jgi:serine phosphatase RsbU (regulator of sigma subunit)
MKQLFAIIFIFLSLFVAAQDKMNELEELARGYFNQGKLVQAAEFYSKAGYAYWNKNLKNEAATSFQKAFDLFSNQGNVNAVIAVGNNLGLIYLDQENYKNAYSAFSKVLTYTRKGKNNTEIYNALINLGTVAFELASYEDAIAKATEALNLARETTNLRLLAKCYSLLAESYEKKGDNSNAYKYFELYSIIDKKIKVQELENLKQTSSEEINLAHEKKRITEIELKIKKGELKTTQDSLTVTERISFERKMQLELRNEQLMKKEIQLQYELHLKRTLIYGIIATGVFLFILSFMFRLKLRDNRILRKQKEEITKQRNKLDLQNKKITDSIHYGLRIQQAMLPDLEELQKIFEAFIIYKPKDIVSGDFYWFREVIIENTVNWFIAIVDCTGHGVPGAFMSMIGQRLLTEIVMERNIHQPSEILGELNNKLRQELDQHNKKSTDGMDVAFCKIAFKDGQCDELTFAGAKRPMLIYHQCLGKLEIIEGDKKGVGGFANDESKIFTDKILKVCKGDLLFLYSDGIIDQQNPARDRFGTSNFTKILNERIDEPMIKIKEFVEKAFEGHKAFEDQRDDITVLGLRLIS